jgi:hypothetical protein
MVVKRCPFCGGEAQTGRSFTSMWWQVGCSNNECYGYITKSQLFEEEDEAAEQWNTRPEGVTTGWIKCEAELPPFKERIMITDGETVMSSVRIDDTEGGSYFSGVDSGTDVNKLQWMPYPDPAGKENAK